MKLLFVITGFGYGDTIRCEAVIQEIIKKNKKTEIIVIGYDNSYSYFKNKFPTLKMQGYNFPDYNLEFKTHRFLIKNFYLPASWVITLQRYRNKIKKFNPDLIISDFEPIANLISNSLDKKCLTIFAYDPEEFQHYDKKNSKLRIQANFIEKIYNSSYKVIIPNIKNKKSQGNIIYVNPIIKKPKLPSAKILMKKLKLKKQPIIVMLGGSDYGLKLAQKINKLSKHYKEDFIFFGAKKKISNKHFIFKKNFLEYLKVSKAVITLAGNLTISEALIFKKPLLIFPIKNHVEQILNAYSVRDCALIGNPRDIKQTLDEFFKFKPKIKNIKSNGAEQVADIIAKLSKTP